MVTEIFNYVEPFVANWGPVWPFVTWGVIMVITVIAYFLLVKLALWVIKKALDKSSIVPVAVPLILTTSKIFLYVMLLMSIAPDFGIETSSIITALGAVGLAVSLAVKDSLSNVMGGALLVFYGTFKLGDYVKVGDVAGSVESIGLIHTTLDTFDNMRISIPNGVVSNSTIINYSANDTRRVDVSFTISRGADIEYAKKTLNAVVDRLPMVLDDPARSIRVEKQNDLGMELWVKVWAKNSDYWSVAYDIQEQGKQALDKAGIELPVRIMNTTTEQQG